MALAMERWVYSGGKIGVKIGYIIRHGDSSNASAGKESWR